MQGSHGLVALAQTHVQCVRREDCAWVNGFQHRMEGMAGFVTQRKHLQAGQALSPALKAPAVSRMASP